MSARLTSPIGQNAAVRVGGTKLRLGTETKLSDAADTIILLANIKRR